MASTAARRATVLIALLAALAAPAAARGFSIDTAATLVPGLEPHTEDSGRHERITEEAIRDVTRSPSANLILQIQRGVENADVVHQFDEETHFDNFNQRTLRGRRALDRALSTMRARLARAQTLAKDNPQFLDPSFASFRGLAADVRNTFAKLVTDKRCRREPRCPTSAFAARTASLTANNALFTLVPNPDPHQPTNPDSPFACCDAEGFRRRLGRVPRFFRERMDSVERAIDFGLGTHRGRTLAQTLGASHPLVVALVRARHAARAYEAAQEIGHALHALEDFFAHTNYAELHAGVPVGSPIPASIDPATGIPLPPSFDAFTVAGLESVLGPQRFAELESGAVTTIWLGEEDACLGDAGVTSIFNPNLAFDVGGLEVGPISIPGFRIGVGGRNANPPAGHRFCHYRTSAQPGLNKDEPGTGEPSHANYPWAAGTARRAAGLLWKELLAAVAPARIIPPETEISVGPPRTTPNDDALFVFDSPREDTTFRCKLDDAGFRPCASPVVLQDLPPGFHDFQVQAVDSVGRRDPTPRPWRWTVTRPSQPPGR